MSDFEDFLAGIESASGMINLDSLVANAAASFRLIEPFSTASSEHPEVTSMLESVKKQNMAYYEALDRSILTAQHGCTFCGDAELLCASLLDVKSSTEDLKDFIASMRSIVKDAHEEALQVSKRFRYVRKGLFQITGLIPEQVSRLKEEKQRASEKVLIAERRKVKWENTTAVATAGAAIVATIALGVTFPPGLIILPVVLPLIGLVGVVGANKELQKAVARETQVTRCGDAMVQLRKAAVDISRVIEHVDYFLTWWQDQDTMLKSLSEGIHQLRPTPGSGNAIRLASVKGNWGQMKRRYMAYVTQISRLQDHYPSARLIGA